MTQHSEIRPHPSIWLSRALRGNALFSLLSGAVLLLGARPVGAFIGLDSGPAMAILGGILILYAGGLYWLTSQASMVRLAGLVAVTLDLAWVIGSGALLLTGWIPLSPAGRWVVLALADVVALFAALQFFGLWRYRQK